MHQMLHFDQGMLELFPWLPCFGPFSGRDAAAVSHHRVRFITEILSLLIVSGGT